MQNKFGGSRLKLHPINWFKMWIHLDQESEPSGLTRLVFHIRNRTFQSENINLGDTLCTAHFPGLRSTAKFVWAHNMTQHIIELSLSLEPLKIFGSHYMWKKSYLKIGWCVSTVLKIISFSSKFSESGYKKSVSSEESERGNHRLSSRNRGRRRDEEDIR